MGFTTGIEVIDRYGGLKEGFVYILEEPGAGGREFAFNVLVKNRGNKKEVITLTKNQGEVFREIESIFPKESSMVLKDGIQVISLEKF
ncbi:hypothetical protein, partial [Thermococcus sp.]